MENVLCGEIIAFRNLALSVRLVMPLLFHDLHQIPPDLQTREGMDRVVHAMTPGREASEQPAIAGVYDRVNREKGDVPLIQADLPFDRFDLARGNDFFRRKDRLQDGVLPLVKFIAERKRHRDVLQRAERLLARRKRAGIFPVLLREIFDAPRKIAHRISSGAVKKLNLTAFASVSLNVAKRPSPAV